MSSSLCFLKREHMLFPRKKKGTHAFNKDKENIDDYIGFIYSTVSSMYFTPAPTISVK